jgi:hypothetical protein
MKRANAVALTLVIVGGLITILNDFVLHFASWISLIGILVLFVGNVMIYRAGRPNRTPQ